MPNLDATKTRLIMWKSRRIRLAVCLILGVAAVFVLWLLADLEMRRRSFAYSEAAGKYREYAEDYEINTRNMYISCYGERWDSYSKTLVEDVKVHRDDRPYRATRADHFRKLQRKYEAAAHRPWIPVTLDPPLNSP